MTTPQLENGYTRVANEILEALARIEISGRELQMVLVVVRKTYGFQKKDDYISLSQFQEAMGISKGRASQIVNRLQLMNILTVKENLNGLTKKYCFNKRFEKWTPLRKTYTVYKNLNPPLRKTYTLPLRKTYTTKESIKETITKESKEIYKEKKLKYLDFVFLTAKEYLKLKDKFGEPETNEWIERLNDYIGSVGKKYKSHYFTMLNWSKKDKKENMTKAERRNIEGEKAFMEKHKEDILKELEDEKR